MVWYSHLFQNFPQFIVIHKVKGFGVVNKAEIDVFLELSCFFDDPVDVGNLISGLSAFFKCETTKSDLLTQHIHIHIYILFFFRLFFIIGYYKILSIVPCAIQ